MQHQHRRSTHTRPQPASQRAQAYQHTPPQPKRIIVFDVLTFAAVFFSIFFASLSQRSIIYNVTISLILLVKVLIGIYFYRKCTVAAVRLYFILRYLYDLVIILPAIIIFRFHTPTYAINYFTAAGIVLLSEVIITLIYCRHLHRWTPYESFEMVHGCKIALSDKDMKSLVIQVQVKETALYLTKRYTVNDLRQMKHEYGEKSDYDRQHNLKMMFEEEENDREFSPTQVRKGTKRTIAGQAYQPMMSDTVINGEGFTVLPFEAEKMDEQSSLYITKAPPPYNSVVSVPKGSILAPHIEEIELRDISLINRHEGLEDVTVQAIGGSLAVSKQSSAQKQDHMRSKFYNQRDANKLPHQMLQGDQFTERAGPNDSFNLSSEEGPAKNSVYGQSPGIKKAGFDGRGYDSILKQ